MNLKSILAIVLLSLAAPACAQVNALPPARHILVYGNAQARAIPDRFKITLGFEAVNVEPGIARSEVESSFRRVLGQLKSAGVPENEIVATSLEVAARRRYDQKLQEQVFVGTAVTRSLTARFSKQVDLEAFLAVVKTSQGLSISDVSTELSGEPELMKALRGKAIESSREKAQVIASAYGVRLTGLYSVSDTAPQFEYGIQEGDWPEMYEWRERDGNTMLDRVVVTGSRVADAPATESLQTGYVKFEDRIYAVFLIAE